MSQELIRNNIQQFYQPLDMPGGWSFNHAETLKMVELYYMGKYKTGQYDGRGFRKFFYNIVKPACDVATKFIDLDTKDILLIPESGGEEFRVWMMQRKLKQWLKDNGFASLLNEIVQDLPKYGHVVLKKVGNRWHKVNLVNLRSDISAQCLKYSDHVYELISMTANEVRMASFNEDAVAELLDRGEDQNFIVYECYIPNGEKWTRKTYGDLWTAKKGGDIVRTTEAFINQRDEFLPAIELDSQEVDFPYRELKWEDVPGRWLGYGFVEYLEDNQIATNEAENLERKGLALKALQLWQTRDDSIGGNNALVGAENGDILKVDSEVTPIIKDNSDLAAFNATRARWDGLTERKTFATDIARGDDLPSRTPLGVANLQAGMVASYYDLKRENVGIFIKDLLLYDVIPSFKEETIEEHVLTFSASDEELEKLDKAVTEIMVGDSVVKYAMNTGFFPSRMMVDDMKTKIGEQLKRNRNRYMKIPKGFYTNANYVLDIIVTGEQLDVGRQSQVINIALQTVSTNPGILQNPATRAIFFKLLSLGGISPVDLNLMNESAMSQPPQQPMQQGGSLTAPQQPQMPQMAPTNSQL